ncbi:ADP-ribose pyrophosphatase YjhB, NUDIX family [Lampropedia hyalina DSM 16112]|jgi:ADP-ribose pyrophosphatase YjhB (NUDIX family)|uniref:ADP-ribose pyrophosphatase YjhB, NUDIX family n=1 Tax=Lampropedia hyalina DSM 16112 TaxID=1122156 RepID=A0A1M4SAB1_9BURK|nr:NUDIX domain-containing protein [Lampropedia hyalina]SHE29108.1 ADP-ribose pyrophosphatase YjhB, NUDIX family [Lampropedia hyalina DSM 16112]
MISFDIGNHKFQLRAAAVIVENGYALLHRLEGDPIWALPGGRVEPGEAAASTVVREMLEETGEHLECGGLLFVVENFFEYNGKLQHEVGLYFRSALRPESHLRNKTISHQGIESDKTLEFRWFQLDELERVKEGLQNPCGKHAPANGMQRKAAFAVNSGAIDRKSQRGDAPSGGMRAAQWVLQTFLNLHPAFLRSALASPQGVVSHIVQGK